MSVLRSEILGTAGVTLAAIAALLVTLFRRPMEADLDGRRRATVVFALLVVLQAVHFAEEYATGFYDRFPQVLGLTPWPANFFLAFNLTCLAVWAMAVAGVRAGYRVAFFPAWFLAIASLANGIAHSLLALQARAYFPGLMTSPLVGFAGLVLWRRLVAITRSEDPWRRLRGILLFFETIAFTVLVPGTVTVLIPQFLGVWGDITPDRWTTWQFAALAPLAVGLAVYVRCVWEFAKHGRGIPAPVDHPKQLVVTGLYRYVRNPMYFGVLFFMLGQSMFFQSIGFLEFTIAWFLFVHINVLLYEEPNLRRKFGDSYERYRASVRRWIPGRAYRETPDIDVPLAPGFKRR